MDRESNELNISPKDPVYKWKKGVINYIKEEYDTFSEVKVYQSWIEFIKKFKDYRIRKNIIFRGHSNNGTEQNFNFWQIQSSLNRKYPEIELNDYLQWVSNGTKYLRKYKAFRRFSNCHWKGDILNVIAFLQHYNIETPFIDFSIDPLIALFFTLTSLPYQKTVGSDSRFISIFELDCGILKDQYNIKELDINWFEDNPLKSDFNKLNPMLGLIPDNLPSTVAMGLIQKEKLSDKLNPNLKNQKGSFVFLHILEGNRTRGQNSDELFNKSIEYILKKVTAKTNTFQKAITLHLIPYDSIFKYEDNDIFFASDPILLYLTIKKVTGYELFSDLQGFKYDYLFTSGKQVSKVNDLYRDFKKGRLERPELRYLRNHELI